MAITKLLRLKASSGGMPSSHLKRNLFYICNPEKTGEGKYITGNAGQTAQEIYETMMENKRYWGKTDQTQGFHYILSFPPDEHVTEEMAMQIALEFCEELLNGNYFFACAVHNDQHHMHAHITFDSVSRTDGKKYHSPKGDWIKRIQPITDRLCEKYHLSTLQYSEERKGADYGEWKHQRLEKDNHTYSWFDIIRDDLDEGLQRFDSYGEMLSWLRAEGYTIRDGKYLSLKPEGRKRPVRTGRLGEDYGKEALLKRFAEKKVTGMEPVLQERYKTYGDREAVRAILFLKRSTSKGWKMTAFQREFYQRWNNTFFIRKPERRDFQRYREDILEVRKLSESLNYLIDHDLETLEAVYDRKKELSKVREALKAQKRLLLSQNTADQDKSEVESMLRDLGKEQKTVETILMLHEQQLIRLQRQRAAFGQHDQRKAMTEKMERRR